MWRVFVTQPSAESHWSSARPMHEALRLLAITGAKSRLKFLLRERSFGDDDITVDGVIRSRVCCCRERTTVGGESVTRAKGFIHFA